MLHWKSSCRLFYIGWYFSKSRVFCGSVCGSSWSTKVHLSCPNENKFEEDRVCKWKP